jgi:hypothetical protein
MGSCHYPTGVEENPDHCVTASSSGACDAGGTYSDASCPSLFDCLFVGELTSHVIAKAAGDLVVEVAAQPGVLVAYDFRDVILRRSTTGREFVDLYAKHAKAAILTLRKHPALLFRALKLVTKGVLIAQDVLRLYSLKGHGIAGRMTLKPEIAQEMLELSAELARLSPTEEFDHLNSRLKVTIEKINGMTSAQILDFLAPGESSSPKIADNL